MKSIIRVVLVVIAVFLGGCATVSHQEAIQLTENTLTPNSGRIGVAMTPLPKIDTHFPGAGCLLCLAAASAANSALTDHTRTLPYEDLPKLKDEVADLLRNRGMAVIVIPGDLKLDELPDSTLRGTNVADQDFSSLKQKYNIDKLLVINITSLGMWRTYSSYFPTSDPKAELQGAGFLVNLSSNTYEWYLPVNIMKSAEGKWDEPPKFPGLTDAYFQALEIGKDSYLKPFSAPPPHASATGIAVHPVQP